MPVLVILSRWLHVVSACVALGGVFFVCLVLPQGLTILEPDLQTAVLLKTRRIFKMVIHSAMMRSPWRREFRHLAPREQRTFAELCAGKNAGDGVHVFSSWRVSIERQISKLLGEQMDNPKDKAA